MKYGKPAGPSGIIAEMLDFYIYKMVNIEMQFGVVPGKGTTDAIFVVRQLQENYIATNKQLYYAFVNLARNIQSWDREDPVVGV